MNSGMPPAVLAKLRAAVAAALEDPLVQTKFPDIGGSVPRKEDRGGERMLEIIKSDVVRWSEVVKKAGGVEAKP